MKLVLDIGGTKTRIGLVSDTYRLLETEIFPTNNNYEVGFREILGFVKSKDVRVSNICVGIAGVLDKDRDSLFSSPNIKGWIGKRIRADFEKELSANVIVENDAALSGLGEAVYGVGKGAKIVAYLTIGTGIGGVRIVNKNIDERLYGFEPGHHLLKIDPPVSSFETLISGKSIKRIYGNNPEEITDKKVWNKIAKTISYGIANTVCFWSPDIVVLGGGVALSDLFNIVQVGKGVKDILEGIYPTVPDIKRSVLGEYSGLWGGIAYLSNFKY
jgi:predicted NBD/HSP70 family sugar kinase